MIRFEELERLGVSVAAFSDKSDGDCGVTSRGDRAAFCARCGVDVRDLVTVRQVHGATALQAWAEDKGRGAHEKESALGDADALITNVTGLPVAVLVADCVPVYLCDPVSRAIGIVHAGRVGTRMNISGATVAAMHVAYGAEPANLHALIGPCAGPEAYEVSQEIADDFSRAGLPTYGRRLDLWAANAQQLHAAGLLHVHIYIAALCTITDGRFHSHRANPDGRRNMALMML
ncbi:MAG TPA: polyphenol oxidase family protein [Candidatus Hydrogenedentes bacterium]|nr:polyphenol oxidase family protein [Candidatus Hydrogenedentota bacterium]